MSGADIGNQRGLPETEIQVAAAAIAAMVSPPLGIAVAAGSALRSPRIRRALRKAAVNGLAEAIELGDRIGGASGVAEHGGAEHGGAERGHEAGRSDDASHGAPSPQPSRNGQTQGAPSVR